MGPKAEPDVQTQHVLLRPFGHITMAQSSFPI